MFRKGMVFTVIILFIGAGVASSISINTEKLSNIKDIKNTRGLNQVILTFYPTDDTYIVHRSGQTNYNFGDRTFMEVENYSGGSGIWGEDSLIRFNLSLIPSYATIVSATLYLYYHAFQTHNSAGRDLNITRITSDWDELAVTWDTRPSYFLQPTSYATVPSSPGVWMAWDLTDDVQCYIQGTYLNFGWKISDDNGWGMGDIPVTSFRTKENESDIPYLEVEINLPPNTPIIDGPDWGIVNVEYMFTINISDNDGDDLFCIIDWGDGTNTEWLGPYSSGETIYISHSWSQKGTYEIKVKLKDIYGLQSDWISHTIVIYDLQSSFIFGRITNLTTIEDYISFEAVNIWVVTFQPFSINPYTSGEQFIITNDYKGFVGYRYIFAFCKMLV